LARNERRTPCCTTVLTVGVGEQNPLIGYSVNIGGFVPHHPVVVSADIKPANVVTPDDEDVRLLSSEC